MIPADRLPEKTTSSLDLLDGIRVIDLTSSVAGPYAGQMLGDLGADVIKVETPGRGDDCRSWGPPFLDGESLWFLSVNRNKRSVAFDIASDEGHETLLGLVAGADVVLVNTTLRIQRKLRIDHATLSAVRPDLVHVSITGFGMSGARADMPCYDLIAEGISSVMDMTGELDGPPQKVGTPAADLLAGEDAALAAIAALFRRTRTGQGAAVDVSLVSSMTRFMAPRLMPHLGSGDAWTRSGGRDSVIAVYQAFDTADDPITLGLGNDAIWKRFWHALGDPETGSDPRFATNAMRREHRPEIVARIADILRTKPSAHWLALFAETRIPSGPINRLDQVGEDADLIEQGFLYSFDRDGTRFPQVGLGIAFDGHSEGATRPPPRLGEHTREVLGKP
ncbi:CoA transferase [Novosphingobium sp. HK4-1]|uniref:CoA transferase n=2 Tax=Novosphingobium mangrovi (ex Huang et al. 2023) TaxID=2976432 RepID=A0ABT2I8R9_9SPHN|nr:CoA transferase [Novosphingobium mangrovi (ex Huang et al. 2023)]